MSESLKLLAVFPHPDDETLGLGGTLAKYAAEGVETHLVCATRGQRGWPGPPDAYPGTEALGRIRVDELRCAARCLGLHQVHMLDYCDGELDQVNRAELIAEVVSLIRRVQPQVVVSFAQEGVYGHPDHIIMAQVAAGALVCAADASFQDPAHLPAFRVPKFYATVDTKKVVAGFRKAVGQLAMTVDGEKRAHVGWEEWAVSACLDVRAHFDAIWQAILCHQSQMPAFGSLTELPRETLQDLFAEATLVLNYSLVQRGSGMETDLFEGIRAASSSDLKTNARSKTE